MVAIDFPIPTGPGHKFMAAGVQYTWNGTGWTTSMEKAPVAVDAYTRAESDARFEPLDSPYTKAESDARYEPFDSAYTKAESAALYTPIGTAYTKAESEGQFVNTAGDTMSGALTTPAVYFNSGGYIAGGGYVSIVNGAASAHLGSDGNNFYRNYFHTFQNYDAGITYLQIEAGVTTVTGYIRINQNGPNAAIWIRQPDAIVGLEKLDNNSGAKIIGRYNGLGRFEVNFADGPDYGGNNGNNFTIRSFNDAGAGLQIPLQIWRTNGDIIAGSGARKPGGGMWTDSSDSRIKNVIGSYTGGLAELVKLNPVRFTYKGNDSKYIMPESRSADTISEHQSVVGKEFIGLIAQEAETAMPEMVTLETSHIDGVAVPDLRVLDPTAIVYALINAVKELSDRIVALESRKA